MTYPVNTIIKKGINLIQTKIIQQFGFLLNTDDIIAKICDKPRSLCFVVTNICNANCIFCGYQYLERPKTILSMSLFKKAIDEYDAFGGGGVGFNPIVGEPLIDPDLIEKISYARNKKNVTQIGLFTNGILINQVGARSIIKSGVNGITVSVGGFDAETYSRIYRVNAWDSVYEGMLSLLKENDLNGNKVKINIGLRSDIPISRITNTAAYRKLKQYKFGLEFNVHYDSWGGRIKAQDLKGTMRLRSKPKKKEPCSVLYLGPMILSNGDLTLCGCRDLNGELVVGNIRDKSILEMWRDPRVESIRKGFYLQKYPKICESCLFYNDLTFFRIEKIRDTFKRKC